MSGHSWYQILRICAQLVKPVEPALAVNDLELLVALTFGRTTVSALTIVMFLASVQAFARSTRLSKLSCLRLEVENVA